MHNATPRTDDGLEYWLIVRDAGQPGRNEILYCEEMHRTRRDFEAAVEDDLHPIVEAIYRATDGTVTRIGAYEIEALQAELAQDTADGAAQRRELESWYRSAA